MFAVVAVLQARLLGSGFSAPVGDSPGFLRLAGFLLPGCRFTAPASSSPPSWCMGGSRSLCSPCFPKARGMALKLSSLSHVPLVVPASCLEVPPRADWAVLPPALMPKVQLFHVLLHAFPSWCNDCGKYSMTCGDVPVMVHSPDVCQRWQQSTSLSLSLHEAGSSMSHPFRNSSCRRYCKAVALTMPFLVFLSKNVLFRLTLKPFLPIITSSCGRLTSPCLLVAANVM